MEILFIQLFQLFLKSQLMTLVAGFVAQGHISERFVK